MNDERAVLSVAAASLELPLDSEACDRLLEFLALLRKWNGVYNLTAVRDAQQMLVRHLIDSLAAVQPLRRELLRLGGSMTTDNRMRLLDVGSGAGLPGIVFAICCPDLQVDCIDAVAKKAAFVRQAAATLSLSSLRSLHARIEDLDVSDKVSTYEIISSRAFASLGTFTSLSSHLLSEHGVWLAMKGKTPQQEIDSLPPSIEVFHVEPIQVPDLSEQRCIVWMRKKNS